MDLKYIVEYISELSFLYSDTNIVDNRFCQDLLYCVQGVVYHVRFLDMETFNDAIVYSGIFELISLKLLNPNIHFSYKIRFVFRGIRKCRNLYFFSTRTNYIGK